MPGKPGVNRLAPAGGLVVQDGRDGALDASKEARKLLRTMPDGVLADHHLVRKKLSCRLRTRQWRFPKGSQVVQLQDLATKCQRPPTDNLGSPVFKLRQTRSRVLKPDDFSRCLDFNHSIEAGDRTFHLRVDRKNFLRCHDYVKPNVRRQRYEA